MGHWDKAESVLKRILQVEPDHQVALYQLSQVYLEQNETGKALTVIRAAKARCKNLGLLQRSSQGEKYRPCLWGGRCIPRDEICTGILIQEADILREMGYLKQAAKVTKNMLKDGMMETSCCHEHWRLHQLGVGI